MVPATGPLLEQYWTNTGFVTGPVLDYHWPMEFTVGEQNESNVVCLPVLAAMLGHCWSQRLNIGRNIAGKNG